MFLRSPTSCPNSVVFYQHDTKGVSRNDPFHLLQDTIKHFVQIQSTNSSGDLLQCLVKRVVPTV